MKDNIIMLIFLIAIILLIISAFVGINKIGVFSVSQIIEKNKEANESIDKESELVSKSYPGSIQKLEETYQTLKIEKTRYYDAAGFSEETGTAQYKTKQYDISYLWKTIGKYATARNLVIEMNIKKNNEELYDLDFTVTGQYTDISQFITDLENDSNLSFRIYNFKMSGSGVTISSSFTIKNIDIDPTTIVTTTNEDNNSITTQGTASQINNNTK